MLPLPSVFAWSVAPTDLPAAVLSPWILWHLREIRPGIVMTEFCCHFFKLNFKLLFNFVSRQISLSCKVFILQTTTLTGLSTREFRTYNLWQISSIIEICFGFQKSNVTLSALGHLSIVWSLCGEVAGRRPSSQVRLLAHPWPSPWTLLYCSADLRSTFSTTSLQEVCVPEL